MQNTLEFCKSPSHQERSNLNNCWILWEKTWRIRILIKGTLSLHIKNWYVNPFDPLSTVIPSKNSVELFNPPKKAPQVEISVLNRDEMVSMAPHFDPYRRQWLHIFIQIRVNGSRIWSKSASMALDSSPIGYCGAIDANLDQILEPLTLIWIKMWSNWHQFGSNSGAIDADMD